MLKPNPPSQHRSTQPTRLPSLLIAEERSDLTAIFVSYRRSAVSISSRLGIPCRLG